MNSTMPATVAGFACMLALSAPLHGAEHRLQRPLRFIVPVQAGTSADIAVRALAQQLSKQWQQPVVVDNRPGASGIVASQILAAAPADGLTICWTIATHATNPALYRKLPYDTAKDFAGVTLMYSLRSLITAAPTLPATSVGDLIRLAGSRPGEITFTSPLTGTIPHLIGELFKRKENLQMEHIAYKGAVAAQVDLMAGRVAVMFDVLANALTHIRAGRLKALAIIGDTPARELPGVPPLPGLLPANTQTGWNGVMVPARTPRSVVNRLNADLIRAAHSTEVQARFATLTVDTVTNTPQEFDAFIRSEIAFWGKVIRDTGIRLD